MKTNFDKPRDLNRLESAEAKAKSAQNPKYEKDGNAVGVRLGKESILEKLSSPDSLGAGDIDIPLERSKDQPRPADLD